MALDNADADTKEVVPAKSSSAGSIARGELGGENALMDEDGAPSPA